MLGVLKRRWKPKRASNGNRLSGDSAGIPADIPDRPRTVPSSVRQVHPLCEDKAQLMLAYDGDKGEPLPVYTHSRDSFPAYPHSRDLHPGARDSLPAYSGRDSHPHQLHDSGSFRGDANQVTTPAYPLTPNICVEGGRIEFIKTPPDSCPAESAVPSVTASEKYVATLGRCGATSPVRISRAQQTDDDEKYDDAKECLEERIIELERALETEHRLNQKDKLLITKLQRQIGRRESLQRDAERERRLRAESELRVREANAEASRCRARLKLLTQEFAKMEENVRSMLVYKSRAEQLKQEKASLTIAFEARSQQYQSTIAQLNQETSLLRQQLDVTSTVTVQTLKGVSNTNHVGTLETENARLSQELKAARLQYERCLDDVAHQVVRALLGQKTLREEVLSLTSRIRELETQNRALTSILVQQLSTNKDTSNSISKSSPTTSCFARDNHLLALEDSSLESPMISPTDAVKHSNSYDLDATMKQDQRMCKKRLSDSNLATTFVSEHSVNIGKRLSVTDVDHTTITGLLSLDDKRRHRALTDLWTEIRRQEVTPQKLLNALGAIEWTSPAKRPATLDLTLPITLCSEMSTSHVASRPIAAVNIKAEEELGSESPESGNRDEGYSTMSSDVQGDVNRSQTGGDGTGRGLEDLAEATDETGTCDTQQTVEEHVSATSAVECATADMVYCIPSINLSVRLNPRNSYPPSKELLSFQHIMRSFSDSHLCLKITAAGGSPCCTLSSPLSSSPSVVLFDVNPLRTVDSWGSSLDVDVPPAGPAWDAEYVRHWLRLDETRSALQQRHREILELEYDRAELEDWSLSLSTEDVAVPRSRPAQTSALDGTARTPGQLSASTLELEEDACECLWNESSYLSDRAGGELVALLMDTDGATWPYASHGDDSPPASWSSVGSEEDPCSKRSSAATSDDTPPVIGTDFTRDFYRLVKFESTKSLASCSSKSASHECPDREQALQNVLNFIVEQQLYCQTREQHDSRPASVADGPRLETYHPETSTSTEPPISEPDFTDHNGKFEEHEDYINIEHLRTELALNEQNTLKDLELQDGIVGAVTCSGGVCIVTVEPSTTRQLPSNSVSEIINCDDSGDVITDCLWDKCAVDKCNLDKINNSATLSVSDNDLAYCPISNIEDISPRSCALKTVPEEEEISPPATMTESQTSNASTPDTVVSRIPRRQKSVPSKLITSSPVKNKPVNKTNIKQSSSEINCAESHIQKPAIKSRIPFKKKSTVTRVAKTSMSANAEKQIQSPVITSEHLPRLSESGLPSNSVIEGPPHRAVSFHERATSKDVIEELNRIIRKGEDSTSEQDDKTSASNLDTCCCSTGWVHVERDIDFNDPKARANLLDVMLASSDSSPTSSCGGGASSDSTEEHADYRRLHRIHKVRRQKKESNSAPCTPSTETAV